MNTRRKPERKTYGGFDILNVDVGSRVFYGVFLNGRLVRSFDRLVDAVKWTSGADNPDPWACECPKCAFDIRRGMLARANQAAEERAARTKAARGGRRPL